MIALGGVPACEFMVAAPLCWLVDLYVKPTKFDANGAHDNYAKKCIRSIH